MRTQINFKCDPELKARAKVYCAKHSKRGRKFNLKAYIIGLITDHLDIVDMIEAEKEAELLIKALEENLSEDVKVEREVLKQAISRVPRYSRGSIVGVQKEDLDLIRHKRYSSR